MPTLTQDISLFTTTLVRSMTRLAIVLMTTLLLSGCPIIPLIDYVATDRKAQFETWVNSMVGQEYTQKCRFQFEEKGIRYTLCGPFIETRQTAMVTEHVHRVKYKCLFGLSVDKEKGVIQSWRYISHPAECAAYFPTA